MPRRALVLNGLLALLSLALAAYIVWEITGPEPARPPARRAAVPPGPATVPPETPEGPAGSYTVIAGKNLFSPTRSEAPGAGAATVPALSLPKPHLYGIVLRDGASIAYLEDPVTKRVAGYRIGDVVAGAKVKTIAADHVVLTRPEGQVDVRLHDPTKPRAPAPPATAGQPSGQVPSGVPGAGTPGAVEPPREGQPPVTGVQPATPPFPPGRRPLPPSILRRVPPTSTPDAPAR